MQPRTHTGPPTPTLATAPSPASMDVDAVLRHAAARHAVHSTQQQQQYQQQPHSAASWTVGTSSYHNHQAHRSSGSSRSSRSSNNSRGGISAQQQLLPTTTLHGNGNSNAQQQQQLQPPTALQVLQARLEAESLASVACLMEHGAPGYGRCSTSEMYPGMSRLDVSAGANVGCVRVCVCV
jgi:hypothetical protein